MLGHGTQGSDNVNGMSAEERLTHARLRRQEQIQRWLDYESKLDESDGSHSTNITTMVKFGDNVTLLEAAARDDVVEVERFLQDHVNPNEANDDGLTALHQACIDNFEDMVRLLIKFGANVNAVDSEQWTPLHAACTCGHTVIAKILIQSGADLLALNADHNMPYDICEDEDTLEYVEKSMAAKGITQQQINDTRSSRERQIIADMQNLLNQGQQLDFKDETGATVMHMAAAHGYADLTKFLLKNNCDANGKDNEGWTPLHAAAYWSQHDVVEILGEQGADPTIKNALGEQAIDVTEDEDIRVLLNKIRSAMKDKKSRKLFHFKAFSVRNNSRRSSGMRGQSFKGRSKRDKKAGISTIEAKSEAQFWSGSQDASDILKTNAVNNNHIDAVAAPEVDTAVEESATVDLPESNVPQCEEEHSKNSIKPDENNRSNDSNGTSSSGGIRSVISAKNRYSLDIEGKNEPGSNSGPGKTLADLKRERSQEKGRRTDVENSSSPASSYGDSEVMKSFKGETAGDMFQKRRKRKVCVIL